MELKESLDKIKEFLCERYRENLAAILIFGSANTGNFVEGKSDIDTIILLKKFGQIDPDAEKKFLISSLKDYRFATQYFHSIKSLKEYIKRRGIISWSMYITLLGEGGSKVIYLTKEFDKLKKDLSKTPPRIKDIREIIQEKDKFELEGYFTKLKGFELTKGIYSHIRRKLQITNYLQNKNLIFDYKRCLDKIKIKNKKELLELNKRYEERKILNKKRVKQFYSIAKELTEEILNFN